MAANASYYFATSLVRSARKTGRIDEVRKDLVNFAGLVAAERRVVFFLLHPLVPAGRKQELVNLVCETDIARRLVRVLLDTKNLSLVGQIAARYDDLARKELGVVEISVRTAAPLAGADEERLRKALEEYTGRRVELSASADPDILAGVWMRIGDKVIDNTLRNELKAVRARLVSS
jgi:F-type H+-transporting ATPase subunit delta